MKCQKIFNWKNVFSTKLRGIKEATIIKFADSDFDLQSINTTIEEFKQINDELKRMCSISEQYQLIDVSKEDKLHIDVIYKNVTNNKLSIQSFNREIKKATVERQLRNQDINLSNKELEMICDTIISDNNQSNINNVLKWPTISSVVGLLL